MTRLLLLAALSAAPALAQSFHPLPSTLPGAASTNSSVNGVSADGAVVVGSARSAEGYEAFYWTEAGGMVSIGDLPDGPTSAGAHAISADGSVIVGGGRPASGYQAFRWTPDGGMEPLDGYAATGVSDDGTVAVGYRYAGSASEAVRWTAAGLEVLGDLPGGGVDAYASAISGDGTTIVGESESAAGYEAFRWTESEGLVALGDHPDGPFGSEAYGVSPDGSVVVGMCSADAEGQACRWDADGTITALPRPTAYVRRAVAKDVSADGRLVVGTDWISSSIPAAMLWTNAGGRPVQDLLEDDYGLDLTGWQLWDVTAVSDDGRVLVGNGLAPDGNLQGWRAHILPLTASEPLPEAGGFGLTVGPNPARGSATLRLVLDAPEAVRVAVYDALGRRVALLHDGPLAAGTHALRFDAAGLPSGAYVVRASGPSGTATQWVTRMR